jgi:hypothetical protein
VAELMDNDGHDKNSDSDDNYRENAVVYRHGSPVPDIVLADRRQHEDSSGEKEGDAEGDTFEVNRRGRRVRVPETQE